VIRDSKNQNIRGLARFGVELIQAAMEASKRQVLVMNETEYEYTNDEASYGGLVYFVNAVDDIVQDMSSPTTKRLMDCCDDFILCSFIWQARCYKSRQKSAKSRFVSRRINSSEDIRK
jgi:hypothetical protein